MVSPVFRQSLSSASELLGFSYISGVPLSLRPDGERPRLQRGVLVENRQQFVLVDGDKLVDGLLTVISHKERVMHVIHYSVQVDGLDISVAHSMYGFSGAISQQAQEDRVTIRETVVFSMGVLCKCVL